MERSDTKTQRIWYGVTATVVIGPGFRHQAGLGRFLIPHPPLVNWLLRRRLHEAKRHALSFTHEIGHFQTAPLALIYTIAEIAVAYAGGATGWLLGVILLSAFAAWEILAEVYTIAGSREFYDLCYRGTSRIPRLLFWTFAAVLTLVGWIVAT